MVVRSSQVILYLTSMERTTLSKTQQKMLVQSSQTVLYLTFVEPTALSTIQWVMMVVQLSQ